MKKISALLYPQSKYLEEKWWHRLAKIIISLIFYLSLIVFLYYLLFEFKLYNLKAYYLAPEKVISITNNKTGKKAYFADDEIDELGIRVKNRFEEAREYENRIAPMMLIAEESEEIDSFVNEIISEKGSFKPFTKKEIASEIKNDLLILSLLVGLSFSPAVIYRFLLYIALGKDYELKKK